MGSVYRARDRELDEDVALKMIARDVADTPGALSRFRQEVKLARRVTHKNVARTFDIGEHGAQRFLTMEFIEGETLGALLDRERILTESRAAALLRPVCEGLAAAHAAGVVHRDLKPENVMLAKDGRVVITDFGVAHAEGGALRTAGGPVGTPAYMAPEQVEGGVELDARVDVYAVGVMLFEMLTGSLPWPAEPVLAGAVARVLSPPPDPRDRRPSVSATAASLILRCMERRRDARIATAREIVSALDTLENPSVSPRSVTLPARAMAPLEEARCRTVAVLPFRATGGHDEYLASGLTEDLIDGLSMVEGLRVRSHGAVANVAFEGRDPAAVGRELGVQVVASGSLRATGDRMRVSARLVSVSDGFQLWAKHFDCAVADVLRVGDEVASSIAAALSVQRAAPAKAELDDAVALELYLRARHAYQRFWADDEALTLFEEALARAPDDPRILSGYALALIRRTGASTRFGGTQTDRALQMAERAAAIAPHLPEPRLALARVHWSLAKPVDAAREIAAAVKAGPALTDVRDFQARMLAELGRPREAIAMLEACARDNPLLGASRLEAVRLLALLGDWDASDSLLGAPPDDDLALNTYWLTRSRIDLWRGDMERADASRRLAESTTFTMERVVQATYTRILERDPDVDVDATFGPLVDEMTAPRRRAFFEQMKAEIYAYSGNVPRALAAIRSAADLAFVDTVWLRHCPVLHDVRLSTELAPIAAAVDRRARDALAELDRGLGRAPDAA